MKKYLLTLLSLLCCIFLSLGLTACGDKENNEVALKGTEVYSETLIVDNDNKTIYGKLPNGTKDFEVYKNISVAENANYHLCSDKLGESAILSKIATLNVGDNVYYLIVENNNELATYTLTLRVKPLYKVSFSSQTMCFMGNNEPQQNNGGLIATPGAQNSGIGYVESQMVEEDGFVTIPNNPTRLGCEFVGWDFDFSQPITKAITINAKWEKNPEMENFEFQSDGGFCEISRVINKNVSAVNIPNYVTSFTNYAFGGCVEITSIDIPDSISNIGDGAFNSCQKLKNISIGKNVKTISLTAFPKTISSISIDSENTTFSAKGNCIIEKRKGSLFWGCDNSTIPTDSGVSIIGEQAFSGCNNLQDIKIPNNIIIIGNRAFAECDSLANIEIPNNVTSIGAEAFFWCEGLNSVTIGDSVTNIGKKAFYGCVSLSEIKYNAINCNALSSDNYAFSRAGERNQGISLTIGAKVKKIPAYLFYPDSYYGNYYSPNIVNVVFETNSLCSDIGKYAFYCCVNLRQIIIPSSVTSIGENVFLGCSSFTIFCEAMEMPNNWSKDWNSSTHPVLWGCAGECGITENGLIWGLLKNETVAIVGLESSTTISQIEIPSIVNNYTVSIITENAFRDNNTLTSVIIGNALTHIDDYAFYNCGQLTNVTIGSNVINFGKNAFSDCKMLSTIQYNAKNCADLSVTDIFSNAGLHGTGVVITIGSDVKKIPANLFYSYSNSSAPKIVSLIFAENSTCTSIGEAAFRNCEYLSNIVFGNNLEVVGKSAFRNCDKLTSILIDGNVTSIKESAFYDCNNLTSVVIGKKVTSIDKDAFTGCYKLVEVYNKSNLAITAGSSLLGRVGNYALDVYTTSYTSKLSINQNGYIIYTDGTEKILMGYTGNALSFALPNDITAIYEYAFAWCDSLTSITIPNSVKSIGKAAFYSCENLRYVNVGDGVTNIDSYAFYSCGNLSSVVIGESVSKISGYAFYYCDNLDEVQYNGTASEWSRISIAASNTDLINATKYFDLI